jgi:beta-1,4-mannosyltransferase
MAPKQAIRVTVVVLGDLGRSPRMRYHALALADCGVEVDLIGYAGSALPRALCDHPRIRCHLMPSTPLQFLDHLKNSLFPAVALARIVVQAVRLLRLLLFVVGKPDAVLVQNPPAVPTLMVALLSARLRSARLVIDWHNLGYTMLALKLGWSSPIVRWMRRHERALGRRADAHLCVSRAMQLELENHWALSQATLLYDRPAEGFMPPAPDERGALLSRLTSVSALVPAEYRLDAPARPAILVSATSWTQDEDFDLLLDALARCDRALRHGSGQAVREREPLPFPRLLMLITGDGPLRESYAARIRGMPLSRIHLQTLWLSPEDYPLLLRAADLGVCLHRSSSGLDLPMKVSDMLGSGLPVCALDYGPCLAERLRHGENGLLFSDSAGLAEQILDLFKGFPDESPLLDRLRRNVLSSTQRRWSEEWRDAAFSTITGS